MSNNPGSFLSKLLLIIFGVLVFLLFAYWGGLTLAKSGKIKIPVWIKVSGTSMDPTLKNNERIKFYFYFPTLEIKRGDIVVFKNDKTKDDNNQPASYVKRVIAMPGEEVMLQDGFIKVNDKVLNEPYVKVKKTTYSESFTPECKKMIVPQDSYFVLGDNRANSKDSRDFGFVKKNEVRYIIYYNKKIAITNFQVEITGTQIIEQINSIRKTNGSDLLKENSQLNKAANARAQSIAQFGDWTSEADKSNFTYVDALALVNYENTISAEIFDGGYLKVNDLIASWQKNKNLQDIYLNPKFQDVGAAVSMGNLGDCKMPIISVVFGGYESPDYDSELINSWQETLNNLEEIKPGWQNLVNEPRIYSEQKTKVDRLNEIINLRIERISSALITMRANNWLNKEQENWLSEDNNLAIEQNQLADELNDFVKNL